MSLEFELWPAEAVSRFAEDARRATGPAGVLSLRNAHGLRTRIATAFPEWSTPGRAAFFERVIEEAQVAVASKAPASAGLHLVIVADAAVTVIEVPEDGGHGEEFDLRRPQERRPVELGWLSGSGFRLTRGGRQWVCRACDDRLCVFAGTEQRAIGTQPIDVFGVGPSLDGVALTGGSDFIVITPPRTETIWEWSAVGANSRMLHRPVGTREIAGVQVARGSLVPGSDDGVQGAPGPVARLRGVRGAIDRTLQIRTAPARPRPRAPLTYVEGDLDGDGRFLRRGYEEGTVNANRGGRRVGFGYPEKEIWLPIRRLSVP
ncbi:hypothetical protein [Microbacterium lacticum]